MLPTWPVRFCKTIWLQLAGLFLGPVGYGPYKKDGWTALAFDLSVLEQETKDCEVKIGSQTLNVVYYPNVISTAFIQRMQAVEKNQDIAALADGANKMIHDWDMVKGKQKVKPDLETLRELGLGILAEIISQVMEDATGDAEAEKNE